MAITRGIYNIEMYRGDNPVYQFVMTDRNEETGVVSPIDISQFELQGQIRPSATSLTILLEIPIVVTDAPNGIFQFQLTAEEATDLTFVTGVYDLQLRMTGATPAEDQVLTFITGTFSLTEEVTRFDPPPTPLGALGTTTKQSGAFKQAVAAGERSRAVNEKRKLGVRR